MSYLIKKIVKPPLLIDHPRKAITAGQGDSLLRNLKMVISAKPVLSLFFLMRLIINLTISFIIITAFSSFYIFSGNFKGRCYS